MVSKTYALDFMSTARNIMQPPQTQLTAIGKVKQSRNKNAELTEHAA
jgi:hypothetical protein